MGRLARFTQKVFGSTATLGQIKKFGSLAAGSPANAINPSDVQALSQYDGGLFAGIVGAYNPAIEDLNGLFYSNTYQLAYLFQSGIPEYDAGTTYYEGSMVREQFLTGSIRKCQAKIYVSLKANNTGNPLTDTSNWAIINNGLNPQANQTLAARNAGYLVSRSPSATNPWQGVCWSPELGLFVAVASSGVNRVMTSPDGINWTGHNSSTETTPWHSVAWSPELGLFAGTSSGVVAAAKAFMSSADGSSWTDRTAPYSNAAWDCIIWCPEQAFFLTLDSLTGYYAKSSDGINWTGGSIGILTGGLPNQWNDVAWSPELGLFVAVASTGTQRVATSTNGTAWTGRMASNANIWRSVCWSPDLQLFVAVGADGGNQVMYSADGINWTDAAASAVGQWSKVRWSPELGAFVAIGNNTLQQMAMYSFDGINWVNATIPSGAWNDLVWAPQKGIFACVGQGSNYVANSRYVKKFIS